MFQQLFWSFTIWKKISIPKSYFTVNQNNFLKKVHFFTSGFWRNIYETFIYCDSVKSWGNISWNCRINIQQNKNTPRKYFQPIALNGCLALSLKNTSLFLSIQNWADVARLNKACLCLDKPTAVLSKMHSGQIVSKWGSDI